MQTPSLMHQKMAAFLAVLLLPMMCEFAARNHVFICGHALLAHAVRCLHALLAHAVHCLADAGMHDLIFTRFCVCGRWCKNWNGLRRLPVGHLRDHASAELLFQVGGGAMKAGGRK
jgi:hypothetical protein